MRFLVLITHTKITDEKHDKSYLLCLKFVVDQFPVIEIFLFRFEAKCVFLNPLKNFQNTTRRGSKIHDKGFIVHTARILKYRFNNYVFGFHKTSSACQLLLTGFYHIDPNRLFSFSITSY